MSKVKLKCRGTAKEGFLFGGGLIFVGLMLELCVGPVVWKTLAWPVNGIILAGFLLMIAVVFLLRERVSFFRFIGTYQSAIPTLAYAVILTMIMGMTRQTKEGMWLNNMLTFWPFVFIYVYLALILGVVILKQINAAVANFSTLRPSLLLHSGLFLVMTTATLGNADMLRLKMITVVGESEWRAQTPEGTLREVPLEIELKQFMMETYDNGTPKRFASAIQIQTQSGKTIQAVVEVNKPFEVDGWKIYQYSYDTRLGTKSQMAVLELVSDPWQPLVYTGIYMMLAGALLLLTYTRWSYKRLLPIVILFVVALCCVSYFMPIIRSTQLVPALQSMWFFPHVLVYIVCYSLMGVAALLSVYLLIKEKSLYAQHSSLTSLDNIVYVGLTFMTIGMLFGALWAKEAWGHYWSWDPKETWAAITWFSYLVYIHYRQLPKSKPRLALWLLIISFVLLQMCWWGINYLPSAKGSSVHIYNV